MRKRELHGPPDAVHAVVGVLWRETLESYLAEFAFLDVENVIVPEVSTKSVSLSLIPFARVRRRQQIYGPIFCECPPPQGSSNSRSTRPPKTREHAPLGTDKRQNHSLRRRLLQSKLSVSPRHPLSRRVHHPALETSRLCGVCKACHCVCRYRRGDRRGQLTSLGRAGGFGGRGRDGDGRGTGKFPRWPIL